MKQSIGQIQGPFAINQNILPISMQVFKIGIFGQPHHIVNINGVAMELGKTGMLEVRDTMITSVSFPQKEDSNTFVDYMAYN